MMKIHEIPAKPKDKKKIRVAAYARVSSEKDAAFHSLEAQTDYYEKYIAAKPDWELVKIYSDNAISGTTINRPEFQQMLKDCRTGLIDLVITKSVTRFARNTVTLLETVRELKKLGVNCYFEKENLYSISPDGELLLTLLAMYAEEEARNASENQKWRIQKMFKEGRTNNGHILGYKLVDGQFQIVPEEAEIVKRIFDMFLSGMGVTKIARCLTEEEINPKRSYVWNKSSVYNILRDEKYTGDMLLQKTYTDDFRTKKQVINRGKKRQFYVENSHEPIINKDLFNRVQSEIERRRDLYSNGKNRSRISDHLFTGVIICGICGRGYHYKRTNQKKYDKATYVCDGFTVLGKDYCPSQKIPEDILFEKTKEVLGVEELDAGMIRERIDRIIVPEHNHLVYYLSNGEVVDVPWKHRSRSESWTPEMRQAAREKTLARVGKEDK